jgi:hypothetical protein
LAIIRPGIVLTVSFGSVMGLFQRLSGPLGSIFWQLGYFGSAAKGMDGTAV